MEEENKNLDQKLAETIDNKLEYTFIDKFLVKELEPTMIEVKVKKPIPSEKHVQCVLDGHSNSNFHFRPLFPEYPP